MSDDDKPQGPVAIEAGPWEDWSEGVRYGGRVNTLSDTRTGGRKIGIAVEILAPGKQSCPFHYHMVEEEHMIGLEGQATLRLGEERLPIRAGDYVAFPAGVRVGHCLVNEGDKPFKFIVIGNRDTNEVAFYPDSGKMMIFNTGRTVLRGGEEVDYWDGEKADQPLGQE